MTRVRIRGSRRQLVAVAVATGMLLGAVVPATAGAQLPEGASRPAVVANPGPVSLTVTGGSLSLVGFEVPLPECGPDGGRCLSMTADLAADGTFRVRPGSLQLPAFEAALDELGVDLPVGLRVEAYTAGDIGGVFLPEGGLARLDLGLGVRIVPELSALPGGQFLSLLGPSTLSCGVGPIRLSLTSGASGGLTGTPYDPATGTLSLVDGAYVVPPVTCSPLLVSLLQSLLGGAGGSLGGVDLGSLLGDVDLASLVGGLGGLLGGVDLEGLGLGDLDDLDGLDLSSLDLRELLAGVNAAVGLPSAPGTSGTTLELLVDRLNGEGPVEGGGERWPGLTFLDVPRGGVSEMAVRWLAAHGITTGVGGDPTRFAPGGQVTRGQMAAFLWRMMDRAGAPDECGFTDVSESAFYASAVCWLKAEGITVGTGDGSTFSPGDPVTRSQMARFLWRLAGTPEASAPSGFSDVPPAAGFADAVAWLRAHGITEGRGGTNSFGPGGVVNRSQMALFLHRLASRVDAWDDGASLPRTVDGEYRCLAIGVCPPLPPCGSFGAPDGLQPPCRPETGGPMLPPETGGPDPVPEPPTGGVDPVPTPDVVGMPEMRALDVLRWAGVPARVAERDGRPLPVTMEVREDRVNLVVSSGVVVRTFLG